MTGWKDSHPYKHPNPNKNMPYITQERRDIINSNFNPDGFTPVAGDYVYWFYKQMVAMFDADPRFQTVYNILVAIHCPYNNPLSDSSLPAALTGGEYSRNLCRELAWLEFYRRIISPYEDAKLQANGDI